MKSVSEDHETAWMNTGLGRYDSCADLARVAVDTGGQGSSLARGARKRQWVKSVSPYPAVAEAGL